MKQMVISYLNKVYLINHCIIYSERKKKQHLSILNQKTNEYTS